MKRVRTGARGSGTAGGRRPKAPGHGPSIALSTVKRVAIGYRHSAARPCRNPLDFNNLFLYGASCSVILPLWEAFYSKKSAKSGESLAY